MTELKEKILNNWQSIVELLARVLDVSCVAITEHDNKYLKIVKTNKSDKNPFKDNMMPEMAGLYCASVTPFIGGGDYSVVIMHEDITKEKEIEEEMNRNRALFQQLFDKSPESIALLDVNGKIVNINKSFETLFGYSAEEAVNKTFYQIIVPESEKSDEAKIFETVFAGETFKGETIRKTKEGTEIFVDVIGYPIFVNNAISGAFAIYENITERKSEEDKIRFLSFQDQLTKLYNRRYFDNEIKRIDNESSLPLTIIFGDLDKLKMVNDAFGHGQGDQYIIEAAEAIRSAVRKSDIVARIGGDEFGIILPNTDTSTAKKIVEKIQDMFNSRNQDRAFPYSISLGTATKKDSNTDIEAVLKQADDDMYKNKETAKK